MKIQTERVLAACLILVSLLLAGVGFQFWSWERASRTPSPTQTIHLETEGTTIATMTPPGRSLFRPGGKLQIILTDRGQTFDPRDELKGMASIQVFDRTGQRCGTANLSRQIASTSLGYALLPENDVLGAFDVSGGGPFRIEIEVTQPFLQLASVQQDLRVFHFRSGLEPRLQFLSWVVAGVCLVSGMFLWK